MKTFGEAERKIAELMEKNSEFMMDKKKYKVILSGKPRCKKGEPKTDIYILTKSEDEEREIKISYKKKNADFIENKMSAERAEQLFGADWEKIIEKSTREIEDKFAERMLIYKNNFKRTKKGSITLGWKFELMNKPSGELSGKMLVDMEKVIDVYSGKNLSIDKKNAMVHGKVIENSGVANYILMDEQIETTQKVIDKMISIEEYVLKYPNIYFACKALNYRTFETKWDGNRPLSVQVEWTAIENKLVPVLIYEKPLKIKGNEMAKRLQKYMNELKIKNTDDICNNNVGTDRII